MIGSRTIICIVAATVGVCQALAVDCGVNDKKLKSNVTSGDWTQNADWENNDAPDAGDDVCIETGKTVTIPAAWTEGPALARSINIQPPSGQMAGGILIVEAEFGVGTQELTLTADSRVDGLLRLEGKLNIDPSSELETLEIIGNGGEIRMSDRADIRGVNSNDVLIITGDTPGSRSTSLSVTGGGIITVELVNDAYVIANLPSLSLDLDTNDKSGTADGHWMAQECDDVAYPSCTGAGNLKISVAITGEASWIIQGHDDAKIFLSPLGVDIDCDGDVLITDGILELNKNFTTTGDLTIESVTVESVTSTPEILVDDDKLASFDD